MIPFNPYYIFAVDLTKISTVHSQVAEVAHFHYALRILWRKQAVRSSAGLKLPQSFPAACRFSNYSVQTTENNGDSSHNLHNNFYISHFKLTVFLLLFFFVNYSIVFGVYSTYDDACTFFFIYYHNV